MTFFRRAGVFSPFSSFLAAPDFLFLFAGVGWSLVAETGVVEGGGGGLSFLTSASSSSVE